MNKGWIKLHRKLLDTGIIQKDRTALAIMIALWLLVDRKTGKYDCGRFQLAIMLEMKPNTVYKALKRLEKKWEQLKPFLKTYAQSLITDFELYWGEKDAKGKERWELQKTWDIKRRLQRWKRNQEANDRKYSQRFVKDEKVSIQRTSGGGFEQIGKIIKK